MRGLLHAARESLLQRAVISTVGRRGDRSGETCSWFSTHCSQSYYFRFGHHSLWTRENHGFSGFSDRIAFVNPDLIADDSAEDIALENAGRALMIRLRRGFPRFAETWATYLADWGGESVGPYIDIGEFAHFVDKQLLCDGQIEEIRRALLLLDELFLEGNEPTRDLIGMGFIEDLQNILSGRTNGYRTVIPLLPPTLLKVWNQIEKQWAGHSSLMDVIEAEVAQSKIPGGRKLSWAEILDLPKTQL